MAVSARFGRVVTAMVTPFDDNLSIDERSVITLVEHLIATGTEAIVAGGTTGESATLTHHEKVKLFRLVKDAARGRALIIAGTGTNNTADSIALTEDAAAIGVDGVLLVTPYYNRPSQEGLFAHYKAIADSTNLPAILYNVPGRTAVNLLASTTVKIANACKNVVAIKEASKDLEQIGEILATGPDGFEVYSGDDGTTLPVLALGGSGVVSVISHINGRHLSDMHRAWFGGDIAHARQLHLASLALTKTLFLAPNPVAVKAALKIIGIIPSDTVRLPMVNATEVERERVAEGLKQYGLL
jgi:4-hydroxy-tetrahydrodipicolinate synthase